MRYTVLDDSTIRTGTAEGILQEIINKNNGNDEISHMNVDEYAAALIENAPYYLPENALGILDGLSYRTEYDKALNLLNAMPASSLRVLRAEPEGIDAEGSVGEKEKPFAALRHGN